MKLWTSVTRVPDDAHHYVVVGIDDERLSDMRKLAAGPVPNLIPRTGYSIPSDCVEANLYARSAATDAVLGQLLMRDVEEGASFEDVIDDAPYNQSSEPVGYDSFESLHNALMLAGSKANPDWCYETYITSVEVTTSGFVVVPVTIIVTEEGAERVSYVDININQQA
jgi:hypothetical protein